MNKEIFQLTMISRRLSTLKGNKGKVFLVGGMITNGRSVRDIDILVQKKEDIPLVKKAMGPFSKDVHYSVDKGSRPSSRSYLTIEPKSLPEVNKIF